MGTVRSVVRQAVRDVRTTPPRRRRLAASTHRAGELMLEVAPRLVLNRYRWSRSDRCLKTSARCRRSLTPALFTEVGDASWA
jgi:hypothetical protein